MGDANWDEVIVPDLQRSALLWDVGAPGYLAAVGVDSDGEEYLALLEFYESGPRDPVDVVCATARHEQVGPLPAVWRRRINGDPRCGQSTWAGRPCRMKVKRQGDVCDIHRKPRCDCGRMMYYETGGWVCFGCHPDRRSTPQQHVHDADAERGAP